jgi:hypothetical protein
MKTFIKKLIREYFEDDYGYSDFDVFDTPKKVKSNKPDNFKNIVKDLGATKTEGKINSYTFQIGPSKIYFKKTLKPNTIELDLISTDIDSRGSGSAKKVMSEFIKVIDKYKARVELSIVPRDKTTDPKMLEKFYKDFGFINTSDFEMRRN